MVVLGLAAVLLATVLSASASASTPSPTYVETRAKGFNFGAEYDPTAEGLLTKLYDPLDCEHTFEYNLTTGQLDTITIPRGTYDYTHDPATGTVTSVTDPAGGSLTYGYDGSLPLSVTWVGEVAGSVEQVYNDDLRVESRTVNGLHEVAFDYTDDGFVRQAGDLELTHEPASGLLDGTAIGQLTDDPEWTSYGELDTYRAQHSGGDLYFVDYDHDAAGRITTKEETLAGVTDTYAYSYDLAGRLDTVTKNGQPYADYDYDDNSNRTTWTDPWGSGTASYDEQDRIEVYAGTTHTYTDAGELASKTNGGFTTSYDYDALGNLLGVTLPDGIQIDYVIDAANRRVGRKVDGTLVQGLLYADQLNPIAELDGTGAVISRFVYASTGHVPDLMIRGNDTYRIVSDHLGSVRLVVNVATGVIEQRLDYGPYGRILLDTNPGFQPFGYAGGLYDHQTGLVRFGARDYDPETGRWTTKDPIGFAGGDTNLYGYVLGDPINGLDPSGLFGWLDGLQLGLDIVGLVPVLGEAADLINGGISLARGDCVGAALSFAAAVPLAGTAATAGKFARKGLKYADEAVEVASGGAREPHRIYSARELVRRSEAGDSFHNFPESFNQSIFKGDRQVISEDYVLYTQRGSINGVEGTFEIGVRPSASGRNEVITHRFFRPDR